MGKTAGRKHGQKEGKKDGRLDGWTDNAKPIYLRLLRGYNGNKSNNDDDINNN